MKAPSQCEVVIISTHTKEWVGKLKQRPAPSTSRPIPGGISPSKAHFHKLRRAQGHKVRGNTNILVRKTCSASLQGCPRRASAPWAMRCHHETAEGAFPHYGIAAKSILRLYRSYYGTFEGETKGGEIEGSRWFGQEQAQEYRGKNG